MLDIHKIIIETEIISEVRKKYLMKALDMRYDRILFPAYKKVKS